jgi:hypothetical protein
MQLAPSLFAPSLRDIPASISLAADSTMKVIANRIRPSANSEDTCSGELASANSLARVEEIELPAANSDQRQLVGVADHEGDGHGLAQRAAQAQHDAADHAGRV